MKALTNDQLAGLSKKQIKKADDFIEKLSSRQLDQLAFNPGSSSRQDRLVDSLDQQDALLLPDLDPLA